MKKTLLLAVFLPLFAILNAQVTQINSNKSLNDGVPLGNNKEIFFSNVDSTLWATDGTAAGTVLLSSTIKTAFDAGGILNGKLIFTAFTPATGEELFITDGTPGGTGLLKDINPGADSSSPDENFALLNGYLYFSAITAAEGRELWRTNGTAAGTTLVKDIVPGPGDSNDAGEFNIFSTGSYLLFDAISSGAGSEVWRSDGSNAGTTLLKDINPGPSSSSAQDFFLYNNFVLFSANDSIHGNEIWRTDGTNGGTILVKDINPGTPNSTSIDLFFLFNGRVYFSANDGTHGQEIWSTDGTNQNTNLLKDIEPGPLGSFAIPYLSAKESNKFIFSATTTLYGSELWESDGTEAGTNLFKDIVPGPVGSNAFIFPSFDINFNTGTLTQTLFQGNKFFFEASTPTTGVELWVSDGTQAGTNLVKDINPGIVGALENQSFDYIYTTSGFFFAANDGTTGNELWKSDGTSAGTSLVADINPGPGNSDPTFNYIINSKIIFEANNGDDDEATDLYVLGGTYSTLPVTLAKFTVSPQNEDALLNWVTLTEVNSKNFTIQRGDDGLKFLDIGTVEASGTSTQKNAYSFTDKGIMNSGKEKVYYRLVLTDKDGKFTTSNILTLKLPAAGIWNAKLLQNPVRSSVQLMLTGINSNVKIYIKDVTGKTITTGSSINGNGQVNIPVGALNAGMYVLVIENGTERKVIKFVKQ